MDEDTEFTKSDYLPIEKTDYGYVQTSYYQQPDLYHEEVVEVESPFAPIVSSETQVFTFLVLGDQNAGKSTFLHSFTYRFDPHFLELTSYLPMLTAKFVNTRFTFGQDIIPMDEIPFLDTDFGMCTFVHVHACACV